MTGIEQLISKYLNIKDQKQTFAKDKVKKKEKIHR